jgi:hypothetical protein
LKDLSLAGVLVKDSVSDSDESDDERMPFFYLLVANYIVE